MTDTIQCPDCRGSGAVTGLACGPNVSTWGEWRCSRCKGTGVISVRMALWFRMGKALSADRIREHCGGRERARMLGLTPRQLNAVEHGKVDPTEALA